MANKIVVFTFSIIAIFVFIQLWQIKCNIEDLPESSLKYANTYYQNIPKAVLNSTKELENKMREVWLNNHSQPEIQYGEPFPSSSSLKPILDDRKTFFVITAIFDPAPYQSRHNLYHNFVRHMKDMGAQLVTIECIFPSLNQTEFQVTEANNPWHIQLKSESVYWMKENLINIALSRLPSYAKWVCWLSANIEFENPNWVELTIKELEKYTVVQIFEKAYSLGPPPENEIRRTDYSFGYSVVHNKTIDPQYYTLWHPHPGYGWAMAVKDFRKINGLPYYCITGCGGHLFSYSLINTTLYPVGPYVKEMHPEYAKMVEEKLSRTYHTLKEIALTNEKEIVGYLSVTITHFWHGYKNNQHYSQRSKILIDHKFNFQNDTTFTIDGLLTFNSNMSDLQKSLLEYFETLYENFNNTGTYIKY